ncbi:hypothetical protein HMPREF0972_02512 [Actinomyces sp. oral taxon 848 str. F0332]|nr:hypothetical protein HMPREF0972_02512 [Actinomyces sp. oral taxon 848 str. F0332]
MPSPFSTVSQTWILRTRIRGDSHPPGLRLNRDSILPEFRQEGFFGGAAREGANIAHRQGLCAPR